MKSHLIKSINELIESFPGSNQNLLLLVAEHSDFNHSKLSSIKASICGAIFPQVIFKDENYDDAIIVVDLGKNTKVTLSSFENFDKTKIDSKADDIIIFLDGLSSHITNFLENLYEYTSLDTNIIGAGAGKMTLKQEKVLFTKDSFIQDGALLLSNSWLIQASAKHGWEQIAGPFVANNTQNTLLHSLDYKDAFEIYKEVVEKDFMQSFNDSNFFEIAKSYPIGIAKINGELLVRDPIARDKNSLILVGDIDNNSVVYILKGNKTKLINSAKLATQDSISRKENLKGIFIVDCISRVLFLENEFKKELQIIKQTVNRENIMMFGVISLGEIANTNHDYIDFYNKTCVIGAY